MSSDASRNHPAGQQQQAVDPALEEAINALQKQVIATPKEREPRRQLAALLRKAGRWKELMAKLRDEEARACRTNEERIEVLLELAEVSGEHMGQQAVVGTILKKALDLDPTHLPSLEALAAHYQSIERWADLIGALERQVPLVDGQRQLELHLRIAGLSRSRAPNQATVIKALAAAHELAPDDTVITDELLQAYESRREWEQLVALRRNMIARVADPESRLQQRIELAELTVGKVRKPDLSITAWEDVLANAPDHPQAIAELERLYERYKRWEDLARLCERHIELEADPKAHASVLQKLGVLYGEKLGDPERACDAWRNLLQVDPDNRFAVQALKKIYLEQRAWSQLQELYSAQGKLGELTRVLERQVPQEKDDDARHSLWLRIASLYQDDLNDASKAASALEHALELKPDSARAAAALTPLYEAAEAHDKLARVLTVLLPSLTSERERLYRLKQLARLAEAHLGDPGRACEYWLEAFPLDWRSPETRAEVERLTEKTREWERMVATYQRVCEQYASVSATEPELLPVMAEIAHVQEIKLHQTDRALETFQEILGRFGSDASVLEGLERLYLDKGRYADLPNIYEKQFEQARTPQEARTVAYKLARLAEDKLNDESRAAEAYRKILDSSPDEMEALRGIDRIYTKQQRWEELAEILQGQMAAHPLPPSPSDQAKADYVELLARYARTLERAGDAVSQVVARYSELLRIAPEHQEARLALEKWFEVPEHRVAAAAALAPVYETLGQPDKLVSAYEAMVEGTTDTGRQVELLRRLAEVLEGDLDNADRAFFACARALQIDSEAAGLMDYLESLAEIANKWVELVDVYKSLFKRPLGLTQQVELRCRLGRLYKDELDETERAINTYSRVIDLRSNHFDAVAALEELFVRGGRWGDLTALLRGRTDGAAASVPEVALAVGPDRSSALDANAAESAIATYQSWCQHDPEDPRAVLGLGRVYWAAGHLDQAVEHYCASAHRYQQRGELSQARALFRRALEVDETNEVARTGISQLEADAPRSD
jgi:golgin subfamily B member 1